MKSRLSTLLLLAILAGCSTNQAPETNPANVNSANASNAIADAIIIDVRSDDEWSTGHIEQAVHIPHAEIADRIGEVTEDKNASIVVHCAHGSRSEIAKQTLQKLGFTNVVNGGGIDDVKKQLEKQLK